MYTKLTGPTVLTISLFASTASLAQIQKDTFRERCAKLGATYASRSVSYSFTNFQGSSVNATAEMSFNGDSASCLSNTDSASITLTKKNNDQSLVRITFRGDGTGTKMEFLGDIFDTCTEDYPEYLKNLLSGQGQVLDGTINSAIDDNARVSVCPAFVNAVKDDLIKVLGG